MKGYHVKFVNTPVQDHARVTPVYSGEKSEIIQEEINTLLEKGAIKPVQPCQNQFVSTVFLVDKKTGGKRPVINLKYLNQFVIKEHFKMTGLRSVLQQVQEGDLMFSIDLTDAYFSIPLEESVQKFFRFSWKGQLYQFLVLPFGLTTAPCVFTKVTKPLMSYLHSRGQRASIYIDDGIGLAQEMSVALSHRDVMVTLFQKVGFVINMKKSHLVPSHRIIYLGFIIDSIQMKVFISQEKLDKLLLEIELILKSKFVTIRQLARTIGLIVSVFPAYFQGPMFYRQLEILKAKKLKLLKSFKARIKLNLEAVRELKWWKRNARSQNGRSIHPPSIDLVLKTDASTIGWGGICQDVMMSGTWDNVQKLFHINVLEMLAVQSALLALCPQKGIHIQLVVDNSTVVAYINRKGGTHSATLNRIAREIWFWALEKEIHLSAIHVAGIKNVQADYLSRLHQDRMDWMLNVEVFQLVCQVFHRPQVDLFANMHNCQLPKFISWIPEPGAWKVNAWSVDWGCLDAYAFPPFSLIPRVLQKVKQDQARILLVTPNWPTQNWWPILLDMLVQRPLLIPPQDNLLMRPQSQEKHPLKESLSLVVWQVSGVYTNVKRFQKELQKSFSHPGELELPSNTRLLGQSGFAGVINGNLIPFQQS